MRNIVPYYSHYFKGKCLDIGSVPSTLALMPPDAVGLNHDKQCDSRIIKYDLNKNALPFKDESFDFILFSHTIEHLDSPSRMLKECHRVLRANGRMIIAIPRLVPWNKSNHVVTRHGHVNFWVGRSFTHTLAIHGFAKLREWCNFPFGGTAMYMLFNFTPAMALAKDTHYLVRKIERGAKS